MDIIHKFILASGNHFPDVKTIKLTLYQYGGIYMNAGNLKDELTDLEGIIHQNPETGKLSLNTYVRNYTNRVFGAPFQLLDSVDKRFDDVNPNVGNEYLRNFLLNSPILRIRPGMPKYTGGSDSNSLWDMVKKLYFSSTTSNLSAVESLMQMVCKATVFKAGSKLQRRMFGFRETYYDYMQHVNYMCRSCAVFLYLTEGKKFPTGAFPSNSDKMQSFSSFDWGSYRMMAGSAAKSPFEYLGSMMKHTFDKAGQAFSSILSTITGGRVNIGGINSESALNVWMESTLGLDSTDLLGGYDLADYIDYGNMTEYGGTAGEIGNKITAVEFMVEPVSFQEDLTNTTEASMLETAVDSVSDIGAEIGWITNSDADTGIIGGMMSFLGSTVENATLNIAGAVQGLTGGFAGNLFSGAISSLKGQKMIYPEIYKRSSSSMDYTFNVTLTSPYGDIYNYYMNILVPLMHLIALAAPRMVTSNTVASPYLVQAYIPGQCTCQLGIISQMTIIKNPNTNKVSVNGFPLEVKVSFTIKELYNAMSISPANDPASFLFNETLNDYMSNLAGLIPSVDTYTKQREATFEALSEYLLHGGFVNDLAQVVVEKYEDFVNPFYGR